MISSERTDGAVEEEMASPKRIKKCLALLTRPIDYIRRLQLIAGTNLLIMFASVYVGCKGALDFFMARALYPYYHERGLGVVPYQTAQMISRIPWAAKGFIGTLSDGFPLFGYHKRPYIMAAVLLGVIGPIGLILLPYHTFMQFMWVAPVLFFLTNLECATSDLLSEGKYSELLKQKSSDGSNIVSFVWYSIMFGKLLAIAITGPLVDSFGSQSLFFIAIPLCLQVLIPTALGYLNEERLPEGKRFKPQWRKFKRESRYFFVSMLVSACAIGLAVVALFVGDHWEFCFAALSSLILMIVSIRFLPLLLACCNIYMLMDEVLKPYLGGAMDFWYLAEPDCVAGGPNFTYTYYATWTGFASIVGAFLGIFLFQKYISKMSFRKAFWITTSIKIVAGIFDFTIVRRWNIAIGIPDKLMYLVGDAIILDIVGLMNFMPSVVLISRLCPDKMESTVYAILAAFSNFGMSVAKSVGTFAIQTGGISGAVPCNFDNLSLLIIICNFLIPMLSIPLTFLLVPDISMEKPFTEEEGEKSICFGLFWKIKQKMRERTAMGEQAKAANIESLSSEGDDIMDGEDPPSLEGVRARESTECSEENVEPKVTQVIGS